MKEILRNRKWQLFSLVLAIALVISLSFNVYQTFNGSNSASNENANKEANAPMNFTFTWGPGNQRIVNGTFRLEISIIVDGENVTMVIKANDDDYHEADYIGLVFDVNQNGTIDTFEESYGLFAANMTVASKLMAHGFLGFVWSGARLGPHKVSFNSQTGYTFTVHFPYVDETGALQWNPAAVLKRGDDNPLHVCYFDADIPWSLEHPMEIGHVFVRFQFFIAEET